MTIFRSSFLFLFIFIANCINQKMSALEKTYFMNPNDLTNYGISISNNYHGNEKFNKVFYIDFSYELNYEFETIDTLSDLKYLSQTITFEHNKLDVKNNQNMNDLIFKNILKMNGITLSDSSHIFKYGDNSYFYVLFNKEGNKVGNIFTSTFGNTVYRLIMIGVYVNDSEIWKKLLEDKLKAITAINRAIKHCAQADWGSSR